MLDWIIKSMVIIRYKIYYVTGMPLHNYSLHTKHWTIGKDLDQMTI